nr:MAG TPA: hypothetical protein [Caudoviricetes sp.]
MLYEVVYDLSGVVFLTIMNEICLTIIGKKEVSQ